MVSPYLLRPLRSLQEAAEGTQVRDEVRDRSQTQSSQRILKAEGPGVKFWDSRTPVATGPRLVWTNAARGPVQDS